MEKTIEELNRIRWLEKFLLQQSLMEWFKNPNMKFRVAFRNTLKDYGHCDLNQRELKEYLHEYMFLSRQISYIQLFIYAYEKYNKNLDSSLNQLKNDYKNLKTKIDIDGREKTTNPIKFIELIRQAVVHNDEQNASNWCVDKDGMIVIRKLKRDKTRTNLKMDIRDLIKLSHIFNCNVINETKGGFKLTVNNKINDLIKDKKLNINYIDNLVQESNLITGEIEEIDNYQKQSLVNCFSDFEFYKKTLKNNNPFSLEFIKLIYPSKNNIYSLTNDILIINDLLQLLETNNFSWNELYNYLYNKTLTSEKPFNTSYELAVICKPSKFISILEAITMFDIITCVSPQKLNQLFPNQDTNKIRNSIVHGRYFYNYNQCFEFYDGIEKLEHIASIPIGEIFNKTRHYYYETVKTKKNLIESEI